ncbi:urease accessory protein UreE [Bradyrhizobium sp. LB7.2]
MIRATQVKGQHRFAEAPADTVVLDFDDRHRRRMAMTGTRGLAFLLDLENAVALRGGDALVLEDGRLVEVVAAPEPLLEIRGQDPHHLIRIGWHLGNRHLPTQIMAKGLRIRRDHVIEAMVKGPRCARDRDRGAIRSRRRRLCRCRPRTWTRRPRASRSWPRSP